MHLKAPSKNPISHSRPLQAPAEKTVEIKEAGRNLNKKIKVFFFIFVKMNWFPFFLTWVKTPINFLNGFFFFGKNLPAGFFLKWPLSLDFGKVKCPQSEQNYFRVP